MLCAEKLSDVANKPIDWLWQGRIAYGKVTLLQGNTGIGKTNLAVKLAADLSNGIYLPAIVDGELQEPVYGEPVKTYYVTVENALDDSIGPLFDLFGGNRKHVYYQNEELGHFLLNDHDIAECVRDIGARLIIVDPWQEFLDEKTCEYDGSVRQMINRIQMVAARTGTAILLAGNFVKSGSSDIARQRGSSELANTLRAILTLKDDPFGDKRVRVLEPTKASLLGATKESIVIRMTDDYQMTFQRYEDYMGESGDVDQASPSAFLMSIMPREGGLDSREVMRLAKEQGYSSSTIYRARKKTGIRTIEQANKTSLWML